MQLHWIRIAPENVGQLWSMCKDVGFFKPDCEVWLLRLDMLYAAAHWGWDKQRIADFLRPGREDWGLPI